MKYALLFLVWLWSLPLCCAAPAPSLESDLTRAETVFIGRLKSTPDTTHFIFEVVTVLRGQADGTVQFGSAEGGAADSKVGSLCLLVSQGDDRYRKPLPVVGRPLDCQCSWRGWLAMPISMDDGHQFVERISSFADGQPFSDGSSATSKLSIERVKSLISRYPYNPHIYGKF